MPHLEEIKGPFNSPISTVNCTFYKMSLTNKQERFIYFKSVFLSRKEINQPAGQVVKKKIPREKR